MKHADIQWQQGQPVSTDFDDIYFSREGGLEETEYVFMRQNGLPERWQGVEDFVIAETGFGTGLNFLTTVQHWLAKADVSSPTGACLHYLSIEKFPLSKPDLEQALACWPALDAVSAQLIENYPPAVKGFHHIPLFGQRVVLSLIFGDAQEQLPNLHAAVDAWYLDGFAPDKNPDMWTTAVFRQIARLSKPGTSFSTFTAAGVVRRGLQAAGFEVEKVKGFGKKREMLRGVVTEQHEAKDSAPWFALPRLGRKAEGNKHAVVIGAGIAGVRTAWSLAKRGWRVDIIERQAAMAQGGSGNPQGIVMPRISLGDSAESEFYDTAFFKAVRELNRLKQQYPELRWQQGGVLQLASSQRVRQQIERLDCAPELAQAISAEQASEIAGVEVTMPALYFPQAGWLDPVQSCQLLLCDAGDNVRLHTHSDVTSMQYVDGAWQLLDAEQSLILNAETVILANASAVSQFSQTAFLPIGHARGQISVIPASMHSKALRCAICHEGYILPATRGEHVIGASFLAGDDSVAPRHEEDEENIRQLQQSLPGLFAKQIPIADHRAALRATTTDRLPLLGPVADEGFFAEHYHDLHKGKAAAQYPAAKYLDGLYVNAGHGARGLTSAFLAAEVIASQVNHEPLAVSESIWQVLSPSRLQIRGFRKGPGS
ncbi:bifunctional tRNA (5-methylaminomethyl-2-thiouridine)(34)-methyltransferase MnmD/FAD-dependent 5-carboxymethylaminomethyl-2-thiouridine(34) oxidoreductase MnmC [Sulfuriflexus mobilis]|uniref:bifunctional tRNA (5-methylaminomethyl-2-thiouridine)(34)-methyltransferase MnmD/FAD-dependent 5-carboxymethylaminomethyl-2-thiouridine(34) oxidoreductase MnmC n=1 Tax=Sulfuriflexus mobilis TaxID=1811807 RepID=UPI000F8193F8|nr:bifunctional tRNA (5-methylaminomethyl-2-thiouridine)(34)-methyltransferase MnmD/FAD-dependent 5-carboxymethylaminomethyl-2-thiouridine(34) oxidoreductase MnmC [Sulfuriflexus mobilis]